MKTSFLSRHLGLRAKLVAVIIHACIKANLPILVEGVGGHHQAHRQTCR